MASIKSVEIYSREIGGNPSCVLSYTLLVTFKDGQSEMRFVDLKPNGMMNEVFEESIRAFRGFLR